MKYKRISLIIIFVLSALLLTIFSTAWSIYNYGDRNNSIKADAAIVLGAAVWGEKPSPVFQERINHAINLYQNGDVRYLIFTGGVGEKDKLAESTVGKNYAIKQGVKESNILTETESRTTQQNLAIARKAIAPYKFNKLLIVSDPLHLKRAVLMARDLGLDAYPSATPTTRYRSFKSQMEFLARETYFYFVYLVFRI